MALEFKQLHYNLSEDGTGLLLAFEAKTGEQIEWHLDAATLTQFLGVLFDLGRRSGERSPPPNDAGRRISAEPLPVSQMGIGPGREPREVMLSARTGIFELLLAVDAGTLLDTLRKLEAVSQRADKPSLA